MFELTGTIKVIKPTEQIKETFRKREFVLDENSGRYPQTIPFEFTQDKCDILDAFNEGDRVKVFFDIRGREWTNRENETKYFLSLNAWKMESLEAGAENTPPSAPPNAASAPPTNGAPPHSTSDAPGEEEDDLPF